MEIKNFNLNKYCQEIVKAQHRLDKELFNERGLMPKFLRERFFELTRFYMENCIRLKEAELLDIVLVGKKAGYYYQSDDPYETIIVINIDNVLCIKSNKESQKKYLWLMQNFPDSGYDFLIAGNRVSISTAIETPPNCGAFSVLRNIWIKKPEIDNTIKAEQLLEDYFKTNSDFFGFMQKIKTQDMKYTFDDTQMMLHYFESLMELKDCTSGLLLYDVLEKSGSLEIIYTEISRAYIASFSS